jgi:hypothetical protein
MDKLKTNLFWTGGWDSTFRLLQSLVIQKNIVQPHYLIDFDRKSLRKELAAMHKIKSHLFEKFPFTKSLLLPTVFSLKSEIAISEKTKIIYENLLKLEYPAFGIQYCWLSEYCISNGIENMELSIENVEGKPRFDFMLEHLREIEKNGKITYIFNENFAQDDFYKLFHPFHWPIVHISREAMVDISKEHDFYDLMNYTWFCHSPLRNGSACGVCTPCIQVYEKGFSYRLSARARFRYHFRYFLNLNLFKEKFPVIFKILRKL